MQRKAPGAFLEATFHHLWWRCSILICIDNALCEAKLLNIFRTSDDPEECARVLADQHVIKMATESAQILATVLRDRGLDIPGLWKATHRRHPCVLWAAESRENFMWLFTHAVALCDEYTRRYGKIHGTMNQLYLVADHIDLVPDNPQTTQPICVPDDIRSLPLHEAYKATLQRKYSTWKRRPRWTRSSPPEWIQVPFVRRVQESSHL